MMQTQHLFRCLSRACHGSDISYAICSRKSLNVVTPACKTAQHLLYTTEVKAHTTERGNEKPRPLHRFRRKRDPLPDLVPELGSDPDTFGDLKGVVRESFDDPEWDETDKAEEEELVFKPERQKMTFYTNLILQHIKDRKLADAIDVLETRMLKEDRVKPEYHIYTILIAECGRVGYEKKAFELYKSMRDRALRVTPSLYTSLFNACANSPYPDSALKRAHHLRQIMVEKRYQPNELNYHAMIKAFGRCQDLQTAFELVDEMIANKYYPETETFNFLLQACISDRDAGFRHALLVWRKMIQKRVKPDLYTFNLFLRCTRDCGMGDLPVAEQLLQKLLQEDSTAVSIQGNHPAKNNHWKRTTESAEAQKDRDFLKPGISQAEPSDGVEEIVDSGESGESADTSRAVISISQSEKSHNRPNLLAPNPTLGNIVALAEIKEAKDRLILLGGYNGVLDTMASAGVEANIITFTQLLDIIPSTLSAEKHFLKTVKKSGVKIDIDFCNMLIKKRSFRFDYYNARSVLNMIYQERLHPDIITFGVLALSCETLEDAQQLMKDIDDAGFRLNNEILGAMLRNATVNKDFPYVMEIMEQISRETLRPSEVIMEMLEKFQNECRQEAEKPQKTEEGRKERKAFRNGFRLFRNIYKKWLKDVKPEGKLKPWDQFDKNSSS